MEKLFWDNAFSQFRTISENMSVSQTEMDHLDFQVRIEESIIRIEELEKFEHSSDSL